MRGIRLILVAMLTAALFTGVAMADERPWTPDRNSPVDPATIQAYWETPAHGTAPDSPWLVGYPYDKVPDESLSGSS